MPLLCLPLVYVATRVAKLATSLREEKSATSTSSRDQRRE